MHAADLDIEDLPPKALRKLIRSMLAKAGKSPDKKEDDKSDEEREALADLHEEGKGKAPKVPVTEDDLPFDLENEAEGDDASGDDDASEMPPAKKKKGK